MDWRSQLDRIFIGGQWVEPTSSEMLSVVNPFDGSVVAQVACAVGADVDRAVGVARNSFDGGEWSRKTLQERAAVLRVLSGLLGEHAPELAATITDEMGCPISLSKGFQSIGAKMALDAFLDMAHEYPWVSRRASATGRALVVRQPVGVVAAIIPWNAPLQIALMKLSPALLAGCSVVLKVDPRTPLNAYLLAELAAQAGIPEGVLSILAAQAEASERLVRHPEVDKVTFTGSSTVGRHVAALCGQDLKRVTLELGGKSAAVLLDDADVEAAAESLRIGAFRNTGQVCSLKTRILVPSAREPEFLDALLGVVESMPVGDPKDPATQLGPLVSARQRERVESLIASGIDQGARLVRGGGRPTELDDGFFVDATVFTQVQPSMDIAQEEIFGPVVSILTYDDEDQAVAMANDSRYGLNGAVFSADPGRAVAMAERLLTGTVEINGSPAGFSAPFGGFKESGIGREAGPEGFDAYVELKSIGLPAGFDG